MGRPIDIPRRESDTRKSYAALCDYCRMGADRSLRKLHKAFLDQAATNEQPDPPTEYLSTLKGWSTRHDWQERAQAFDAARERRKQERDAEIMETGLARPAQRVQKLKRLHDRLEEELYEKGKLWLEDVKQIGSGADDTFEKIKIWRYNSALVSDLRGVLDDLAAETNGRISRQDITTGGDPVTDIEVRIVKNREEDG